MPQQRNEEPDDLEDDPKDELDDETPAETAEADPDGDSEPDPTPDPRDAELARLREDNARLERMTRGGGYREVAAEVSDDDDVEANIAALQATGDPRDKMLAAALKRTSVAERRLAMVEEAQELGANPSQLRQMRKLIESGHAGSMAGAKLILRGLEAENAEKAPRKPKDENPPPAAGKNPKTPPSREVAAEAARRAASLRRSPGATGSARVPEGEGGQAPPSENGEGGVRFVKAATWKTIMGRNDEKSRSWLRAERAGRVRVTPD